MHKVRHHSPARARAIGAFVLAATLAGAGHAGAQDLGKKTFEQCIACHSLKAGENGTGPTLHGIFGSTAGTVEGFRFSGPMKRSGVVWNDATLAGFIRNPQEVVPNTRMPYSGLGDEAAIAALIAYLKTSTR